MPYEFFVRDGFVEVRLFGVLGALPEQLQREELDELLTRRAVLYDYSDVERMDFDPTNVAGNLSRNVARGIRVAAVSTNAAWYGVNREIQAIANAEPSMASLFHTRGDAVRWLQRNVPNDSV